MRAVGIVAAWVWAGWLVGEFPAGWRRGVFAITLYVAVTLAVLAWGRARRS
jgi:hypothetical protein